ncbi:MAG: hypothetical protein QG583_485 [Patescibacteria group bacterium]|nr:hypothetical protein [Patescibacteria group bacterium]
MFEKFGNFIHNKKKKIAIGVVSLGAVVAANAEGSNPPPIDASKNTKTEISAEVKKDVDTETISMASALKKEKEYETGKKIDAEDIKLNKAHFVDLLKEAGIVGEEMTSRDLDTMPKAKLTELGILFAKKTGRTLAADFAKNIEEDDIVTVLARTSLGVSQGVEQEQEQEHKENTVESFDFNEWFKEQIILVKQGKLKLGKSVLAPNGISYKIELSTTPSTSKKISDSAVSLNNSLDTTNESEALASAESDSGSERFILLKDKYPIDK